MVSFAQPSSAPSRPSGVGAPVEALCGLDRVQAGGGDDGHLPDLLGLLSRVGCHVYTGELLPSGEYRELFTGPGLEGLLGLELADGDDATALFHAAVHPEDWQTYIDAGTQLATDSTVSIEYRLVQPDGSVRWVLDRMWLREPLPNGSTLVDGVVTDVTELRQRTDEARAALGQLRHLAHNDSLTGLPNRASLSASIEVALGRPSAARNVTVLLLDLDGFKAVNDSFGHATGDDLLRAVSRRLSTCLRPGDVAARLGGDEFAVVLETTPFRALAVGERILRVLQEPLALGGAQVVVTASIGAVHAEMHQGPSELLRDADVAMYTAKSAGKNRMVVFEPAMQRQVAQRLRLETQIRRAVELRQFELRYQPLQELGSGHIVGAEALLRWRHPEKGLLLPSAFISTTEDNGLIVPLGRWVLEEACSRAALWLDRYGPSAPIVSVNLSPRQLQDAELVATVESALNQAALDGSRLQVEITETLLMNDSELAARKMSDLQSLGIRVALDDFGTGFSSLAYLRRYPVDVLKIDQSFVGPLPDGPRPAALVRSIIELARALDMTTVAEGVETAQQAKILEELGCHTAQGFYFGKPSTAALLEALLDARRSRQPDAMLR